MKQSTLAIAALAFCTLFFGSSDASAEKETCSGSYTVTTNGVRASVSITSVVNKLIIGGGVLRMATLTVANLGAPVGNFRGNFASGYSTTAETVSGATRTVNYLSNAKYYSDLLHWTPGYSSGITYYTAIAKGTLGFQGNKFVSVTFSLYDTKGKLRSAFSGPVTNGSCVTR